MLIAALLSLSLSLSSSVDDDLAGSKPHIIFILQDDAGHYDFAFNGNHQAKTVTANISALASEGIILKSHYTHWHCSPTRRSFISGRLPVHHHEQLSGNFEYWIAFVLGVCHTHVFSCCSFCSFACLLFLRCLQLGVHGHDDE